MANTVISRPDLYPVGTSVKAYLERAAKSTQRRGVAPGAASVETQTVAAGGALTFTTLVAGTQYLLHATVNGVERYLRATGTGTATIGLEAVPKPKWKARRQALGLK